MTASKVKLARRLARIRDRIADRARAELARHDAAIRAVHERIDHLERVRHDIDGMVRPVAGRKQDDMDRTIGAWNAAQVERALVAAGRELEQRKAARAEAEAEARRLAIEAERASKVQDILKGRLGEERARRQARVLDEIGSRRRT